MRCPRWDQGAAVAALAIAVLAVAGASPASATTYCVAPMFPMFGCSGIETADLQVALDRGAPAGQSGDVGNDGVPDEIVMGPSVFSTASPGGFATAPGKVDPLVIRGSGPSSTTITMPADVKPTGGVLTVRGVTLRDLTVELPDGPADSFARALVPAGTTVENAIIASRDPDAAAIATNGVLTLRGTEVEKSYGNLNRTAILHSSGEALTVERSVIGGRIFAGHLSGTGTYTVRRSTVRGRVSISGGTGVVENSVLGGELYGVEARGLSAPATVTVDHSTIVNLGDEFGAGVNAEGQDHGAQVLVTNSIVRGYERSVSAKGTTGKPPATVTVRFSALDDPGGSDPGGQLALGEGVTQAAPTFADAAARDFRLVLGSAGIDAGDPAAGGPVTDLAGAARVLDGNADGVARRDMGAYEVDGPPPSFSGEPVPVPPAGPAPPLPPPSGLPAGTTASVAVPRTCRVPRVKGLTLAGATRRLRRAGCAGRIRVQRPKAVPRRRRASLRATVTAPTAGRVIAADRPIVLRIALPRPAARPR